MLTERSIIDDNEMELILKEIYNLYGYDFFDYSKASLKRRMNRLCILDKTSSYEALKSKLSNSEYFTRFVEEITVNVTEMFRDPLFYKELRSSILPSLAKKGRIRIWHAGCSTGEEVFSMAIVLKELNLLDKTIIYGTDLNPKVLENAKSGLFQLQNLKLYSENYMLSGGNQDFSSYYTASYDQAQFHKELSKSMLFSLHNLVSDGSFQEFDLIVCRNVLIYFEKQLQNKVFELFDDSLQIEGYIALGARETLNLSPILRTYKQVNKQKIWQKIR